MQEMEILARNEEEARTRAAGQSGVPAEFLDVIEEYEPDEIDLKTFKKQEGLEEPPSRDEITLYVFRAAFEHYRLAAETWVGGLIERFAPGSTATASRFRNIIVVQLEVPDPSILIGKQGATLDALQHVTVRALLTIDPDFPDIMLDVERYRERKLVRLEKEARRASDRALRNGRKVPLSPMSPAERKFVHNCLKGVEGIETESEGEGRDRRVIVKVTNRGGARRGRGGGRGPGGGKKPHPQYGPHPPDERQQGPQITDEQRQLLYGNVDDGDADVEFEDEELEDRSSLLPEYREGGGGAEDPGESEKDRQRRMADEIE